MNVSKFAPPMFVAPGSEKVAPFCAKTLPPVSVAAPEVRSVVVAPVATSVPPLIVSAASLRETPEFTVSAPPVIVSASSSARLLMTTLPVGNVTVIFPGTEIATSSVAFGRRPRLQFVGSFQFPL